MRRNIIAGLSVLALVVGTFTAGNLVEMVDSSEAVRIQYPTGGVAWYVGETGPRLQMLGRVTPYSRRGTVRFQPPADAGAPDGRLSIDFNDRGTGQIQGSINYELSSDPAKLELMYANFKTQEALEESLIKPAVNSSIYLTGQLMSSFESYSSRKSELVAYVEDQTQRGLYRTQSEQVEQTDELDPTRKTTVTRASVVQDEKAPLGRARTGGGEVDRYGIRIFQFAIENLAYDNTVNDQIKKQQEITQSVNTSRAEALRAQQQAITAEAEGRARVAQAEAEQKTKNATLVEEARGRAAQAEQDKLAAEYERQAAVLRAQGEAEASRLKVSAGLSPQERAQVWLDGQKAWASAMAGSSQPLVPSVVMGGGAAGNALTGWQAAMEAMGVQAMRQLGLDLSVSRAPQARAVEPTSGRGEGPAQPQRAARR